ncbi:helix-turn-helix transcriptional regulator [Streptomyces sp. NPDC001787]|uniref:helix-turn-helix transcriptional regulator n=1 Tax=Streptomyces sp. NPDC001787 TaxID=3154523 RepID=UPI00332E6065
MGDKDMTASELSCQHAVAEPCHLLAEARGKRHELVSRGRWREADVLVERALRETLRDAHAVRAPDLADLTYVPGARMLGSAEGDGRFGYSTAARAGAVRALLLANRGLNRAEAVRQAGIVLGSPGRNDIGGFWAAVLTLIYANELAGANGACARAATVAQWSRSALHRDALALLRGRIWAASGKVPKAVSVFGRVRRERDASPELVGVAAAWHAEALSAVGEHRQAYIALHESGFDGAGTSHPERAQLLAARSAAHLAAGNFRLGLEDALASGECVGMWGVHNPAVLPWRSRAAVCASGLGRTEFAAVLARQEHELARRWGTKRARGIALNALGIAQRDDAGGIEAVREAEALLSGAPDTLELTKVRFGLGCLLLSLGRREQAEGFLSAAADTELRPWSAHAAATLRRMADGHWTPSLTEQEKKVARLALAGRTNKEVATGLHLTARTVEFHLSNTYRKLGISGREELVTAALLVG